MDTSNIVSKSTDEYYISYCAQISDEARAIDLLCALIVGNEPPPARPETALCVRGRKEGIVTDIAFYILYGDHREAYSKRETLEDSIQYFLANIHLMSHASDRPTEAKANA